MFFSSGERTNWLHLGSVAIFTTLSCSHLSLSVSAFLFGALKAYGFYRGRVFGGILELGGPIVAFFLVLVLGFQLPPPALNFPLTIFVYGSHGPHDLILRGVGSVLLDTGGLRRTAYIDNNGTAFFPEISAIFRDQNASVGLDADGYELANPDQKVNLSARSAYVEVRQKAGYITGHVKNERGDPLVGVSICIPGITTLSAADGSFNISVPGQRVQSQLTLRAVASGYIPWSSTVVPNSNEVTVTLHKK